MIGEHRNIKMKSNRMKIKSLFGVLIATFFLLLMQSCKENLSVVNLKTEYQSNPLGIDVKTPRFSWQMREPDVQLKGVKQVSYLISVKNENGEEIWNSGDVKSDNSLNIVYAGKALKPCTRYSWDVTVKDNKKRKGSASAWFETGFLNSAKSAWGKATWIGGGDEDLVLKADYLSIFKLSYNVQLTNKSSKAGFIFGANDRRFFNKDYNLYNIQNGVNEGYVKVELDLSGLKAGQKAKVNIYRSGYKPGDDASKPLDSFDVPHSIISHNNMYASHRVYVTSEAGLLNVFIDGEDDAHKVTQFPKPPFPFMPSGFNVNPVGTGGDYICYIMLNEIGFQADKGQSAVFSDVSVKNYRSPNNTLFLDDLSKSIFASQADGYSFIVKDGYEISGEDSGKFVVADPSKNAMPLLRAKFSTKGKTVKSARLYVTARGVYKMLINGEKVGDDYLTPGLTQYNKTHLYQTYDVTNYLKAGDNVIGAMLGEGWWSGNITFAIKSWNMFGDRQSLLAKLIVKYKDGTVDTLDSNTKDWKFYNEGPLRYGSFFQGEVYDFTKEEKTGDWTAAGFNDSGWKNATDCTNTGLHYSGSFDKMMSYGHITGYDNTNYIGHIGTPVKVVKELSPIGYEEVRPGVFVYDMGQNMVGFPKITLENCTKGDTITLRYAEVKYPDLEEYKANAGMIMLENIRAALAQDMFVLKDGSCVLEPDFTYHGYRYLEVTGVDKAIPMENIKGMDLSSVTELASSYETSDTLINKLWENINWSFRDNFVSIPTDCPQRNERMGWSGDLAVFCKTASYLSNVPQFLNRHLMALRDVQLENGYFTDVAPLGGGFGGILWGSVGIMLPWETYQQYDDVKALKDHYPAMKKYMAYLMDGVAEDKAMTKGMLGDWLSPEYDAGDNFLLYEAYFANNLNIMSKVAKVLGNKEDALFYGDWFKKRKAYFNATFVDPETKKTIAGITAPMLMPGATKAPEAESSNKLIDNQTSYAVPIALGLFNEDNLAAAKQHLKAAVERKTVDLLNQERPAYSLMTGFIGTFCVSNALSESGNVEVAYKQVLNDEYPSWLYPVKQGATTIWERLNSYTKDNGFGGNNSMNSFNHYSFGAVGSWMLNHSLGIQREESSPGFQQFVLAPEVDPTGEMTFAKGHYESLYGKIESSWKVENGKVEYDFIIPANTTATIILPETEELTDDGNSIKECVYMKENGSSDGKIQLKAGSGTYHFSMPIHN